ncbi:MAG TPA: hypothetical protein VG325_15685 [Solirubrobacteraceae bacterium]|nr:hypothetical protein [Solirubrobacteraceae bacterium]
MSVVRLSAAVIARRPVLALCALVLACGVAACGNQHPHSAAGPQSGENIADANNNGAYVFAGPVTYQLQISRELNQYSTEDAQYVKGLPSGTPASLPASEMWYGVFLWAKNQTHSPQMTSDNFKMVDTQGDTYYPVKLNATLNSFTWSSQTLQPGAVQPEPDTIAGQGPTQGGLLLFKVSTNVFSNRPLTLYILGSQNQQLGSISLDL